MSVAVIQLINKILEEKNPSFIEDNLLNRNFFVGYEEQFDFIEEHIKAYGNIPDSETFLEKFQDWELFKVTEKSRYLLDKVNEEELYGRVVKILQKAADITTEDSNAGVEYLLANVSNLTPANTISTINIVKNIEPRYEKFKKVEQGELNTITTGFKELDVLTNGLYRGEDFVVVSARTGVGKTFVITKMAQSAWKEGETVGFISPEMSANSIGYRFDSANNESSLSGLLKGNNSNYKEYLDELRKKDNSFYVSIQEDFNFDITISKIRTFCIKYGITILFIDGISYISDERAEKGITSEGKLRHVSADLRTLSTRLGIPIVVAVQQNRSAVKGKNKGNEAPSVDNLFGADAIGHSSTRVLTVKQIENTIEIEVSKNTYGPNNKSAMYKWDIDTANFVYIPSLEEIDKYYTKKEQKEFKNVGDLF